MARATILGVDTALGAYLARLLLMRGYAVSGVGDDTLLARLGIAGGVARSDDAAGDEVYDLRGDPVATAALVDSRRFGRLLVTVPIGSGITKDFVVARVGTHESRLGPGTSFVARIIAAVAAGGDPAPADLAAAADCGWTPEYVDPLWRMLQRDPLDLTIATGRSLGGIEVARHAFEYFGRDPARFVGEFPAAAVVGDPGLAQATLGWSATTWGRDLVRTLCEGVAEKA